LAHQLSTINARLEDLLSALERGDNPGRARFEETLTDGYAWALKLDAECARLERSIGTLAGELDRGSNEQNARQLSAAARRLGRARRELAALRNLLSLLREEAAAQVA
jgi:hypothetical protein